jgi:gentisate 1,2-dioxygenase
MTLQRLARRTTWRHLAALCFALLLFALPGAARAQSDRVTGDWQQFVLDGQGAWRALGVYRVEETNGEYRMTPVSQSQDPDVTTSKGLSNVQFTGKDWTFNSDWGNGDVAEFRLRRIGPGIYAGMSYLREEQRNYNLWVLIR